MDFRIFPTPDMPITHQNHPQTLKYACSCLMIRLLSPPIPPVPSCLSGPGDPDRCYHNVVADGNKKSHCAAGAHGLSSWGAASADCISPDGVMIIRLSMLDTAFMKSLSRM